eukprot:8509705-Pyramimonas_sp.AAC.1
MTTGKSTSTLGCPDWRLGAHARGVTAQGGAPSTSCAWSASTTEGRGRGWPLLARRRLQAARRPPPRRAPP